MSIYVVLILLLSRVHSEAEDILESGEITYLEKFYEDLQGEDSWKFNWDFTEGVFKNVTIVSKRVTEINLDKIGLQGIVPEGIDALSNLEELDVSNNEVKGIPDFSRSSSLKKVNASFNEITSYTGSFSSSLEEIILNNNSITADVSEMLKADKIPGNVIQVVNLNKNKLSGSLPTGILNKLSLTTFNIAHNKISGEIPSDAKDGLSLDVSYNMLEGDFPDVLKGEKANARCNRFNCETMPKNIDVRECFCPDRGTYAKLDGDNIKCTTCQDGTMANKWVRFDFWTEVDDYACETPTNGCVNCMFPRNCVAGGCIEGAEGATCEICKDAYRMVAGRCEECLESTVPIAALVLMIILVIIIGYGAFLSGLSILAATMIKQIFSYLQIYYLTMDIKAAWPTYWGELGDVFKLSMINSQAFDLECLTDMSPLLLFYIHWAVTCTWPILMTLGVMSFDKSYSQRIKQFEKSDVDHVRTNESMYLRSKQSNMRRIWIMFILIMFAPMTALCLRLFACDWWNPVEIVTVKWNDGDPIVDNQWFYDNSVNCNNSVLQGVNFLATMLMAMEFCVIVLTFLILFRIWRMFDEKEHQKNTLFGALHESYNEKGLFCEPLMLLRKFILIMTTQLTYLPPQYAAGVNCVLSFAWLLLILTRQPYISSTSGRLGFLLNNWCNVFEISASILIFIIQLYGLLNGIDDSIVNEKQDALVYIVLVLNAVLVIVWMTMFILVLIKVTRSGIQDRRSRRSLRSLHRQESRALQLTAVTPVNDLTAVMNPGARVTPVDEKEGGPEGKGNEEDVSDM